MFRCDQCGLSIVGEKVNFKTVSTRTRKYKYYTVLVGGEDGHRNAIMTEDSELAHRDGNKIVGEMETEGTEISKEMKICKACLAKEQK